MCVLKGRGQTYLVVVVEELRVQDPHVGGEAHLKRSAQVASGEEE